MAILTPAISRLAVELLALLVRASFLAKAVRRIHSDPLKLAEFLRDQLIYAITIRSY